jgi:hypothetical protein
MTSDDDLRARFAALRRAERGTAPPLDAILARPRPPRRRASSIALAAAAVVVALLGARLVLRRPPNERAASRAPSVLEWRSPTASLLRTPGQELLRTVPTLRSSLLRDVPLDSLTTVDPGA